MTSDLLALVISLKRHAERRAHAEALAAALPGPGEILDAVDGRALDPAIIAQASAARVHFPPYPFALSPGEVGVFMSFRRACERLIDSRARHALVLEDDAVLSDDFAPAVERLMGMADQWSYVQLHARHAPDLDGPFLARRLLPQPGMHGLIFSREAAGKLLAASATIDRPIDALVQLTSATSVPVHHLSRPVVADGGRAMGGTTITPAARPTVWTKLRREAARPAYRLGLYGRAILARVVTQP